MYYRVRPSMTKIVKLLKTESKLLLYKISVYIKTTRLFK